MKNFEYSTKQTELLPLGSIVALKEGDKKLMIYGRAQMTPETKEDFDYVACLWPEGNLDEEFTYLFNNSDVDEVFHHGYTDAEDSEYLQMLGW